MRNPFCLSDIRDGPLIIIIIIINDNNNKNDAKVGTPGIGTYPQKGAGSLRSRDEIFLRRENPCAKFYTIIIIIIIIITYGGWGRVKNQKTIRAREN